MLKVQEIRELIRLIDQSSIDEFVYEFDGGKLMLKKNLKETSSEVLVKEPLKETPKTIVEVPKEVTPAPAPAENANGIVSEQPKEDAKLHKITSPMVGTFYKAPSPGAEPYVTVGSKVKKDTIVCIVEAMKLFNEIEADVEGEIVEVLVEDGQLVEFGQPLFLVKTN